MLACTASMVVTTIVIGVLLWAILTISRDTVPFGVSVLADRIHHPVVLRATRLWHRICATVTIAAIALLIWFHLSEVGARRPGLPSLVVVVQIRAALACWVLVRLPIIRAKRAADWYARLRTLLAEARAHGMSEQNVLDAAHQLDALPRQQRALMGDPRVMTRSRTDPARPENGE